MKTFEITPIYSTSFFYQTVMYSSLNGLGSVVQLNGYYVDQHNSVVESPADNARLVLRVEYPMLKRGECDNFQMSVASAARWTKVAAFLESLPKSPFDKTFKKKIEDESSDFGKAFKSGLSSDRYRALKAEIQENTDAKYWVQQSCVAAQ